MNEKDTIKRSSRYSDAMPNQRTSHKEKMKHTWYIPMANYVVKTAQSSNDMDKIHQFYRMANGEVPSEDTSYVLKGKVCTDNTKGSPKSLNRIRRIDFLQPIKDKYMGEFTSSYNNFLIYTNDPEQVLKRNRNFADKIKPALNQALINAYNELTQNGSGEESQIMDSLEETKNKFIKEWDAQRNKEAFDRLQLLSDDLEFKRKYERSYYDSFATASAYTRRMIVNGTLEFHSIPADELYRVNSGNFLVEDDAMCMWMRRMPLHDIIDRWENEISESELAYLYKLYTNKDSSVNSRIAMLKSRNIDLTTGEWDGMDKYMSDIPYAFMDMNNIPVIEYDYITEVPAYTLEYLDSDGTISKVIVDEDYKLDTAAGDISMTKRWVQRVYTGAIIGRGHSDDKAEAIYIKPEPLKVQRELFTNTNKVKLSFNGYSGTHPRSKPAPIPYRINDHLALYRIIMFRIENAINSWKSFVIVPQELFMNNRNQVAEDRIARMQESGVLLADTNSKNISPAAFQAIKEVATNSTYNFIQTLSQFSEQVKAQAWEEANMNASRMGDTSPYQGKGVTENNAKQQMISSNWDISVFNYWRCSDMLACYDWSRIAWADGKSGEYYSNEDRGTRRVVVDPMEHLSTNIGMSITDDAVYKEKLNALKEIAFSAGQNGNFKIAAEAVTNDNIKSLSNMIDNLVDEERSYNQQMEELRNQGLREAAEIDAQEKQLDRDHDLDKINLEGEVKSKIVYEEMLKELAVWEQRMKVDVDGNGHITEKERANYNGDNLMEEYRRELAERQQNHRERMDYLKFEESKKKREESNKTKNTSK